MKRNLILIAWAASAGIAVADDLALTSGETYTGSFAGFKNHRFIFKTSDGTERNDFASTVKSIKPDAPQMITVQTMNEQLNDVIFKRYEKFNLVLLKNGREFNEPATLLKQIDVVPTPPPRAAAASPDPVDVFMGDAAPATAPAAEPGPATRPLSGNPRWRMTTPSSTAKIISQGETVDLDKVVPKGVVSIVHFHFTPSLTSTREGNYVEALTRKSGGRIALLRIVISDWKAPICKDLGLESLPQFWFYSRSGAESGKLTARFTESDIDEALSKARRDN